jgi:hypothetical protein
MEIIGRRKVLQRVIDAEERLQSLPDGFTSARQ